ncbi:hypothetical protein CLIB1423_10S03224 [[Candida] railenensis]|uniref:C3H1-type domain-containing protein n=1 Tax=[Candida] railenensis TaxID=45579 RepID=A0A9P0QPZ9_9ASCO|nr:hypothetical protein CLIB1423_10S03224 [[Candida] railenensis]
MNNSNKSNLDVPLQPFGSLLSLADLPTHLPNTIPVNPPPKPEVLNSRPAHNVTRTSDDHVVHHHTNDDESTNAADNTNLASTEATVDQTVISEELDTHVVTEKEKICIAGTSITLDTEEDIQKWIEERKKRWPTRKNIEEKEKAQKDKLHNQQQHTSGDPNNKRARDNNGTNSLLQDKKRQKRICHFYQQNKKCRFGAKCKNVHEQSESSSSTFDRAVTGNRTKVNSGSLPTSNACVVKTINDIQVNIPQRFKSEFYNTNPNSGTLFKMLVQKDHYENDNESILQFLEYLDKKKLVDHSVKL